jgi:hypothetical protein
MSKTTEKILEKYLYDAVDHGLPDAVDFGEPANVYDLSMPPENISDLPDEKSPSGAIFRK